MPSAKAAESRAPTNLHGGASVKGRSAAILSLPSAVPRTTGTRTPEEIPRMVDQLSEEPPAVKLYSSPPPASLRQVVAADRGTTLVAASREVMCSASVADSEILETIKDVYARADGYTLDPHSAIGVAARATTAPGVHRVMSAQLRSLVGLAGTRSYCVALQRE